MSKEQSISEALAAFDEHHHTIRNWSEGAFRYVAEHPKLTGGDLPIIHSSKFRMKDRSHLVKKIDRKWEKAGPIDGSNLFHKITDLAGGRILHVYRDQFPAIHDVILEKVGTNDWVFFEKPKAITWDREAEAYFESIGLDVEYRESHYTSIHYIVKPRADSIVSCEIQVRTLFEEIWGEIDHSLNYPEKTDNKSCSDQLLVLAKLVGAGSRLADSIFSTHNLAK